MNAQKLYIVGHRKLVAKGVVAAGVALAGSSLARASTVQFSDQTFTDSNWTLVNQGSGSGGSAVASQVLSGGNPGAYRQATVTVNSGTGFSAELGAHLDTSAVYTPSSQGSISSLALSLDAILQTGGFGNGLGEGIALEQGGTVYFSANSVGVGLFTTPDFSWTSHQLSGLTASDFFTAPDWLNSTAGSKPDFSSSGAPITLGYYTDSVTAATGYTMTGGVDNFNLTVSNAAQAVPLPPAAYPGIAMLAAICTGVVLRRRARQLQTP